MRNCIFRKAMIYPVVFSMLLLCSCGKRDPILIITREKGSGTRAVFEAAVGRISENAAVTNSNAVILLSVSGSERAIAYIPNSAFVQAGGAAAFENIKIIPIVSPQGEEFKIKRQLYAVLGKQSSEAAEAFLLFALSQECRSFALQLGYEHLTSSKTGLVLPQKIVIGGSSSVVPFFELVCERWNSLGGNAVLLQSDSSSGLQALGTGLVDIALCSRELEDYEKQMGFSAFAVLCDELIVIANKRFDCSSMSPEELRFVFSGGGEK